MSRVSSLTLARLSDDNRGELKVRDETFSAEAFSPPELCRPDDWGSLTYSERQKV